MHHWLCQRWTQIVKHRLLLRQEGQGVGPSIFTPASSECPLNYTRSPNDWVFFASGLMKMRRWNGVRAESLVVGIDPPTLAPALLAVNPGDSTGSYSAYLRYVDEEGNVSNLSPVSAEITATNAGLFAYSDPNPAPSVRNIVRKQFLRNTSGQRLIYYVDVDTEDLAATGFSSTRNDIALAGQTAVAIFDVRGNSIANRHSPPRDDKPIIVSYYDRILAAGEVTYETGHVELTFNSTTVTGIGTSWPDVLAGRFFYIVGHNRFYEIDTVDVTNQTLTLTKAWDGSTDKFAIYAIRSAPAERKTIFFTEPGLYNSWPSGNGFQLEETGDQVTALAVADSFLYIFERRHTYRLTFHRDPIVDGGVFLSALRGCVNQRSWIYVDGMIYALDDKGIYRLSSAEEADDLSVGIQDLFWLEHLPGELHVNWEAQKWFHVQHHREEGTIRWFVALSGQRLPRHAICYSMRFNEWWLEEYAFPIGHSSFIEGPVPKPVVAGPARRVFQYGPGTLDGVDPRVGTVRGTATTATHDSLSDGLATWPASNLIGNPVAIVSGRGKGQTRVIASVAGTTLRTTQPWLEQPDTTSIYQLGAIPWSWRSHWLHWADEERSNPRTVFIAYQPCASACTLDVRIYEDYGVVPNNVAMDWPFASLDSSGLTWEKGKPDQVIDLTNKAALSQLRLDDGQERHVNRPNLASVELRGFAAANPMRIYQITVEGAVS